MPLPALATQADVEALLGRPLTTTEVTYATAQLLTASGLIRSYTRQSISQVLNDVVSLHGTWEQIITLPQRPVTNIVSVVVNGVTWAPASYLWDRYGNITLSTGSFQPDYGASLYGGTSGLLGPAGSMDGPLPSGNSWMGPGATVVVTYDHGYATTPSDIVNKVAGMVALQMSAGVGVTMEMIGNYKVMYQRTDGGGLSLTAQDRKDLNVYRRTAASMSVSKQR